MHHHHLHHHRCVLPALYQLCPLQVAPFLAALAVALSSLALLCYWSGGPSSVVVCLLPAGMHGLGLSPLFASRGGLVVDLQAWPSRLAMAGRHVLTLGGGDK